MLILFLQILGFSVALVSTIWILGVGLMSAIHPKAKLHGANIFVGMVLLAVTIWLPFVFGWING